jgi:hypothetical protein
MAPGHSPARSISQKLYRSAESAEMYEPRRSGAPIKRIVLYPGDGLFNESKIVVKQFLGSRTGIDRASCICPVMKSNRSISCTEASFL